MSSKEDLAKCLRYLDAQINEATGQRLYQESGKRIQPPTVTVCRQTGAGGQTTAQLLAAELQRQMPGLGCPWMVFDRNVIETALEEHDLPRRLSGYLPEDRRSYLDEIMDELLGLHPPSTVLFQQMTETILHLAEKGQVIIVGYGAQVIAARLDNVFHVRFVASEASRVQRVQAAYGLEAKAAMDFMHKEDEARRRFLKQYFNRDIEDPLLYHLVINTDKLPPPEAAAMISQAVMARHARAVAASGQPV